MGKGFRVPQDESEVNKYSETPGCPFSSPFPCPLFLRILISLTQDVISFTTNLRRVEMKQETCKDAMPELGSSGVLVSTLVSLPVESWGLYFFHRASAQIRITGLFPSVLEKSLFRQEEEATPHLHQVTNFIPHPQFYLNPPLFQTLKFSGKDHE